MEDNSAEKKDDFTQSETRLKQDTIPDGDSDEVEVEIMEVDESLLDDETAQVIRTEKTQIQRRLLSVGMNPLIAKLLLGDIQIKPSISEKEPTEEEQQALEIAKYRQNVHSTIAHNFLFPALELADSGEPLTERSKIDILNLKNKAINYVAQFKHPAYASAIDGALANQIIISLNYGDWHSKKGLKAISDKIKTYLRIPEDSFLK